jgi:hypothetical protein
MDPETQAILDELETGSLLVDMGMYEDDVYTPFPDSGEGHLLVVNAIQGGEWTMPAVRILGANIATGEAYCTVTTDAGERVGETLSTVKFFPADDDWLEIQLFPIRIRREPAHFTEPLDDIYGLDVTFTCSFTDDLDTHGEHTIQVVLVGPDGL